LELCTWSFVLCSLEAFDSNYITEPKEQNTKNKVQSTTFKAQTAKLKGQRVSAYLK